MFSLVDGHYYVLNFLKFREVWFQVLGLLENGPAECILNLADQVQTQVPSCGFLRWDVLIDRNRKELTPA